MCSCNHKEIDFELKRLHKKNNAYLELANIINPHEDRPTLELAKELIAKVAKLEEENKNLLQANKDNGNWFDVLKKDFDALKNAAESKDLQAIADVLESFRN